MANCDKGAEQNRKFTGPKRYVLFEQSIQLFLRKILEGGFALPSTVSPADVCGHCIRFKWDLGVMLVCVFGRYHSYDSSICGRVIYLQAGHGSSPVSDVWLFKRKNAIVECKIKNVLPELLCFSIMLNYSAHFDIRRKYACSLFEKNHTYCYFKSYVNLSPLAYFQI